MSVADESQEEKYHLNKVKRLPNGQGSEVLSEL
jgi:hypothetical protein